MKISMIAAASIAAAATIALAATAHADPTDVTYEIMSPSGNIACVLAEVTIGSNDVYGQAACDVVDHRWAAPPLPPDCHIPHEPVFFLSSRSQFIPRPAAIDQCHAGNSSIYLMSGLQTLDYGQTRSVGAITCESESSGITCTDTSSGHFFRVSKEFYELG